MYVRRHNRAAGFTLLEMMLSTALFLALSSLILGGMISVIRNYRSLEIRNALEQRMRSAFELMAQEIGQAGLQASGLDVSGLVAPLASITQTITSTGVKTVTVDKIGGIFQGASLVVNDGTNQETVIVTAMSTTAPYSITANFALTHTNRKHATLCARGIPRRHSCAGLHRISSSLLVNAHAVDGLWRCKRGW